MPGRKSRHADDETGSKRSSGWQRSGDLIIRKKALVQLREPVCKWSTEEGRTIVQSWDAQTKEAHSLEPRNGSRKLPVCNVCIGAMRKNGLPRATCHVTM